MKYVAENNRLWCIHYVIHMNYEVVFHIQASHENPDLSTYTDTCTALYNYLVCPSPYHMQIAVVVTRRRTRYGKKNK